MSLLGNFKQLHFYNQGQQFSMGPIFVIFNLLKRQNFDTGELKPPLGGTEAILLNTLLTGLTSNFVGL